MSADPPLDRSGTAAAPAGTAQSVPAAPSRGDADGGVKFAEVAPIRVPDWMREPQPDRPLTRAERLRLGWAEHSGKLLGGLAAVVVLAFLAVLGIGGLGIYDHARDNGPLLPDRRGVPGQPRPTDADGNSISPWAATPAESFAAGADAIVPPPARAAGPFTAEQVTDALATVRQALVEARLDRSMVELGDPAPFLDLLAADSRAEVRDDLSNGSVLNYATRVDDDAEPGLDAEDRVRAQGTVSYRATTDQDGIRVLEITTSFIWVYHFDLWRAQEYPPGAELVTVRDRVVWHLPHPDDVRPSSRGLWVQDAASTLVNADCAGIGRGFLALAPEEPLRRRPTPGPTGDVYDPNWRPGDGEAC